MMLIRVTLDTVMSSNQSRDYTIKDSKSSEPSEYEPIKTFYKLDSDVKMDANPAYHATS